MHEQRTRRSISRWLSLGCDRNGADRRLGSTSWYCAPRCSAPAAYCLVELFVWLVRLLIAPAVNVACFLVLSDIALSTAAKLRIRSTSSGCPTNANPRSASQTLPSSELRLIISSPAATCSPFFF